MNNVNIVSRSLEDLTQARSGPGSAIVDVLDLPANVLTQLEKTPPQRVGQSQDINARLLDLNKSVKDDGELQKQKQQLLLAVEGMRPD